jgi:hypothetical protein
MKKTSAKNTKIKLHKRRFNGPCKNAYACTHDLESRTSLLRWPPRSPVGRLAGAGGPYCGPAAARSCCSVASASMMQSTWCTAAAMSSAVARPHPSSTCSSTASTPWLKRLQAAAARTRRVNGAHAQWPMGHGRSPDGCCMHQEQGGVGICGYLKRRDHQPQPLPVVINYGTAQCRTAVAKNNTRRGRQQHVRCLPAA